MLDVLESAQRLIRAATGEPYGDGMLVTNIGTGMVDTGDSETVWVTGNWNPKRFPRDGEPPLANAESLPSRLGDALERIGVECLWLDEYDTCNGCYRAIRTVADSYMWQPNYLVGDDGYTCFDCLDVSDDYVLTEFDYVDNPDKAVPDVLGQHLDTWGWTKHNGTYENGWHRGQDDNPHAIFDALKSENVNRSVVFRLDETSQFYVTFTAWIKDNDGEDN